MTERHEMSEKLKKTPLGIIPIQRLNIIRTQRGNLNNEIKARKQET
jgi:hypothetical protein